MKIIKKRKETLDTVLDRTVKSVKPNDINQVEVKIESSKWYLPFGKFEFKNVSLSAKAIFLLSLPITFLLSFFIYITNC